MKMSWKEHWVWITFLVALAVLNSGCFSEARHNPSEAVLVGTVYCNTCQHFSKAISTVSGASVAVECGNWKKGPRFGKEVKTDENGEFKVNLPFSVIKHVKKTKGFCSVKLITSSEPLCAVAASSPATSTSSIHLKETKEGKQIFSAGSFTFKPDACNRKPNGKKTDIPKSLVGKGNPLGTPETSPQKGITSQQSKYLNPDGTSFPPPIQDAPPRGALLPPVTQGSVSLPLPEIPFLPGIPGFPPVPKKTENLNKSARESQSRDEKTVQPGNFNPLTGGLPPNPLLPPPSQLPMNPFLPPASITPPIPSVQQQPFPFLPSPSLPTPLPQFPFQPTPLFPGVPPAAASFTQKKNSP